MNRIASITMILVGAGLFLFEITPQMYSLPPPPPSHAQILSALSISIVALGLIAGGVYLNIVTVRRNK